LGKGRDEKRGDPPYEERKLAVEEGFAINIAFLSKRGSGEHQKENGV